MYGKRLIKFLICMVYKKLATSLSLAKKLRTILSNSRDFLKQTFQELTLPKVNQQPVSKIRLCPNNNLKIFFLFHCYLLRQHLRFLRPKALKKLLQSSLHTQKKLFYSPCRYVRHKCRCISFP